MKLYTDLKNSFIQHIGKNAFVINGVAYSYGLFAEIISTIRAAIAINISETEKNIGLVANDDIETYAAIIALWMEGKAYVPLDPEVPPDRNESILQQAFLQTVIDSSEKPLFPRYRIINSKVLQAAPVNLAAKAVSGNELAYILFTSGTTGQPKGVPITRSNVEGFVSAFEVLGLHITNKDKCLQMFELTFDLSVMSYLIPLLKGASIYTIPKNTIKYLYIYDLMEEQQITVALMVPSVLQNLRPYFSEINLAEMRYSLFCGEALPLDVTEEWSKCLPNASILNVYGPTEATIFCTYYTYAAASNNKSYNGLLSIGKAMQGSHTVIINEKNEILTFGNTGQLCLGGIQLTPGYWNNEEKNKEAFFDTEYNGLPERFYKTGDICKIDTDGNMLYIGRSDSQVKVQGFRVELSEIEFHVKAFLQKNNAVAVAYPDAMGNTEIGLVIEAAAFDTAPLLQYIKTKMPAYMIPKKIQFTAAFPLNNNGKTDRNKLGFLFKNIQQ